MGIEQMDALIGQSHHYDYGQWNEGFPKVAKESFMKQGVEILVVDDDQAVREAIKSVLEYSGHVVRTADGGKAALELLAQCPFDIVITDFSMPGMRGDQLVAHIREQFPDQPIIMVTGFIDDYAMFGRLTTSVDALLFKPFSFIELNQTIERILTEESVFADSAALQPSPSSITINSPYSLQSSSMTSSMPC